ELAARGCAVDEQPAPSAARSRPAIAKAHFLAAPRLTLRPYRRWRRGSFASTPEVPAADAAAATGPATSSPTSPARNCPKWTSLRLFGWLLLVVTNSARNKPSNVARPW